MQKFEIEESWTTIMNNRKFLTIKGILKVKQMIDDLKEVDPQLAAEMKKFFHNVLIKGAPL